MGLPDRIRSLFGKGPWEGAYRSFAEVPVRGPGFDGDAWLQQLRDDRARVEDALRRGGSAASPPDPELLALAAPLSRVRVVDFGGGGGVSFLQLAAALPASTVLDYRIVERAPVCDDGNAHFKNDARLRFHPEIGEALGRPDIVYIRTALQYLEDYRGVLGKLLDLQPKHLLLTNFSGTTAPTFATAQINQKGSTIPYLFINFPELDAFLGSRGYASTRRKEIPHRYKLSGLPPECRSSVMVDLLYTRAG
ncbi:MAG: methyltransferase, TIGR04325 family [Planctomycetaceae bacterium]|nr:methyltransferase, TIGR04325 family [Planctomycetaceae bacterium]